VLNSVVSVFYYFRVMIYMYMKDPAEDAPAPEDMSWPVKAIIALGTACILFLGLFPRRFSPLPPVPLLP
jgi:NADH-quinone oxidoreductase subunit N